MVRFYLTTLFFMVLSALPSKAQIIYSDPSPIQETTKNVRIYFNAEGTPLEGISPDSHVYAHTGCNLSNGQTWVNAPQWGNNDKKYELYSAMQDMWTLDIPDLRSFYGITDPNVNITGLNFVFRNAGSDKQTGDLFLPVLDEGLQIQLTTNLDGDIITEESAYVTFSVNTTVSSDISLYINNEEIYSVSDATSLREEYLFPSPGEYTVKATASAAGETASTSITLHYLSASGQADYPGGIPVMGPVTNPDGSVTFCLGAPEKKHVMIVGSWNDYAYSNSQVMSYQDTENGRYFWTTVYDLDPEEMYVYYYVIDGGEYYVGDPYARLVLDPYNDKYLDTNVFPGLPEYPSAALNGQNVPVAIYQGSINNYQWMVNDFVGPDPTDLMIYELLFRDFTGTEGKAQGNGTVRQAIEKFDYLKQLGVNAIELLPIMEFNGNQSWGYNPNFYFAVDKAYGTPEDYKEFIDLCHQNGMAVILDMVFNQSDGLHPWYQMYPAGKNPFYNLDAPHAYSVLNDWNQGMPMVQEQWKDVIEYWMKEYKFDGFRFDLVKGLGLNTSYANNGDAATNAYNESRVEEMRYLQDIILAINPNGYCINENLAGSKEENEMAETGMLNWANVNDPGCQFAMGWQEGSDLNRMYAPDYTTYVSSSTSSQTGGRTWGSTVSYLESHDEQRLAYKQDQWGITGVKGNAKTSCQRLGSAAAQMIMVPGAHMIWQFSEMGNAQNTKNNDGGNNVDPKIVNWNLLDEPNHRGLYDSYCELIEIRLANKEMFSESADFTMLCKESNWENGRTIISKANGKEIFTLINPNVTGNLSMNVSFTSSKNDDYQILSKSYDSQPSFDASKGEVIVPANCYVVIGSKDLTSGVEEIQGENDSLKVYGGQGEIIIDFTEDVATVFSMDGKTVGQVSHSGSMSVATGIYIVKNSKHSKKVIVK